MKIRQNKILGYLAVTAGVGCASSVANAAVVFYGNAGNSNLQADPNGITVEFNGVGGILGSAAIWMARDDMGALTQGTDLTVPPRNPSNATYFSYPGIGMYGGAVAGSMNYANISFDGHDGIFEAVAQFHLDASGNGYLMAIATTNPIPNPQDLSAVGGPALSISAGKAMIDAAAVPEPTSLGLLALGATGLATRRQRRKAA